MLTQSVTASLAGRLALPRPPAATVHLRRQDLRRRATEEAGAAVPTQQLEDAVELFMKRQAELESGAAFARTKDPEQVIGGDVVSEEQAKAYCREVVRILRTLKAKRDMTVNEARLIVAIEDPRTREQRQLGIEDERGVSRDEMAAALLDVAEGRIPKDRLALKCLLEDMQSWPFLDADDAAAAADDAANSSASSSRASSGPSAPVADDASSIVKPYIMSNELRKGEEPQSLTDMLPDWVGYGTLYGISIIPVLIVVAVVSVLFFSSLK